MDKTDFLYTLKKSLKGKVSILEIDSQIEYYENFIESEKEKGISEEEILSDLGDPKLIAKTIFDSYKKNLNSDDSKSKDRKFKLNSWYVKLIGALIIVAAIVFCIFKFVLYNSSDYKVTLADYNNISISQADIKAEVESIRASYSTDSTKVTEGTVANGDIVDISYIGTVDGVAFDGGTADNQELTIGSGTYIDGFEDGILGKKIGTTFDLPVTFPTDYSSTDLAGKNAVFSITINSVNTPILPEYTDDWVATISNDVLGKVVKTTAEFEKSIASFLILDKVFSESKLKDYNKDTYDLMVADQLKYYKNLATQQGVELDYFLSVNGTSQADLKASALDTLKWQAIIFEVASLENLNADTEYESTMLSEAKSAGYDTTAAYIKGEALPDYYMEYTKAYALYPQVVDIFVAAAKITN